MSIVIKEIIVKTTIEGSTRKQAIDEQTIRSIKEQIKAELKEDEFRNNRVTERSKSR